MRNKIATILLAAGLLITTGGLGQATASTTAPTIKTYTQPPFDFYKISRNDTLYFIGKRYGVTVNKLIQLNPMITCLSIDFYGN